MNEILIASGSLSVRMDLDEALTTAGFTFLTTSTGRQTREILNTTDIGMLVLDPVLRDGDGMQLLAELRENEDSRSLPILLLCSEEDSERLGDSDVGWEHCEFLGKPYDKDHLLDRAAQYGSLINTGTGEVVRPEVLALDEDEEYLATVRNGFEEHEFSVTTCPDRERARELMQQQQFDAILVNVRMLERASRNLKRWLRTSGQGPKTAIIVLTESEDRAAMISAFSSGADDYAMKSAAIEGLIGRVRGQMRRKSAEHENQRMRETLLIKAMQTTEAERARRNAEARSALIAELEQKNKELERARQAAEAGTEAKSSFLASMSHEIRTPMNAILGMAEMLDSEEKDPEKRQRLDVIRSSGAHLLTLIDQILDFSKIEAGKMEIDTDPVDIRACVEDALEIVAFQAAKKQLDLNYTIESDVPAGILGDVGRIRQVLINFLSNAVKFTEQGQVTVEVSVDTLKTGTEAVHFVVSDSGIGIEQDQLPQLFKTFSQLDPGSNRRYGGTGLGLAISRRLVEMMDGEVWCDSQPGAGSVFGFALPRRDIRIPAIPAERDSTLLRNRTVLILDDNDIAREVLGKHIEDWGGTPVLCANEAAMREILAAGIAPDLFMIDLRLGSHDGIEVGNQLRTQGHEQPQILVSAVSTSLVEARGFDAFVSKPVRRRTLFEVLGRLLPADETGATAAQRGQRHDDQAETVRKLPARRAEDTLPEMRVLLVEDNAVNRQVAHLMLQKIGIDPRVAEDGTEAVARAQHESFDVILMDINMPGMDGVDATQRIHAYYASTNSPAPYIVALTAAAQKEDRERCLQAGMSDFVPKPVSGQGLREALLRASKQGYCRSA